MTKWFCVYFVVSYGRKLFGGVVVRRVVYSGDHEGVVQAQRFWSVYR